MPVIGARFLQVLDAADERAVDLDGEPDAFVRLEPLVDRVLGRPRSPPGGDTRLGSGRAYRATGSVLARRARLLATPGALALAERIWRSLDD
jgi:hypothetical protein